MESGSFLETTDFAAAIMTVFSAKRQQKNPESLSDLGARELTILMLQVTYLLRPLDPRG